MIRILKRGGIAAAFASLFVASVQAQNTVVADVTPSRLDCNLDTLSAQLDPGVILRGVETVQSPVPLCRVQGVVTTTGDGAPNGQARFELNLPATWNRKFLFLGGGGFDGNVPEAPMPQLGQGFATLATDSGGTQDPRYLPGTDAGWLLGSDGKPDPSKLVDYAYRSRSEVNAKVRPLVARYYVGQSPQRAYFLGCSGGGREALIEAQRNPTAYDGFVAGNPMVSTGTSMLLARNFRILLDAPIPYSKLAAVNEAVLAQCDQRDGVADGLIQNPAACGFDPKSLVPSGVLTVKEAEALTQYLSAPMDTDGRQVGFGASPSGVGDLSMVIPGGTGGLTGLSVYLTDKLSAQSDLVPWGPLPNGPIGWLLASGGISAIGLGQPGLSILDPSVVTLEGRIQADVAGRVQRAWTDAVVDPSAMDHFFASKAKLLIYHGYEDTILDPYQTVAMYERMVRTGGGMEKTREQARLFMAPGMAHCFGGSGPSAFDALGAMEAWAEQGEAPDAIVAVKFQGNQPGGSIERGMPLCPFPQQARYDGKGDVMQAASWSCQADDQRMLEVGPNGEAAGIGAALRSLRK